MMDHEEAPKAVCVHEVLETIIKDGVVIRDDCGRAPGIP